MGRGHVAKEVLPLLDLKIFKIELVTYKLIGRSKYEVIKDFSQESENLKGKLQCDSPPWDDRATREHQMAFVTRPDLRNST